MKPLSFLILISLCVYGPVVVSMRLDPLKSCPRSQTWISTRYPRSCLRAFSSSAVATLVDSLCQREKKRIPNDLFRRDTNIKQILRTIRSKLYETREWPHVDPTPGEAGYCQLIAGLMIDKINALKRIDLDNCTDDDAASLLPLVKAFIIQEEYNPKRYVNLNWVAVKRRLESDLELVSVKKPLSNSQYDVVKKAAQESFVKDVFQHYEFENLKANIEQSMKLAMDKIHNSDCLLYTRFYDGTPERADIFSVAATPRTGNLYRRKNVDGEQWERIPYDEVADLLDGDDRSTILQVHCEGQQEIADCFYKWGLDTKADVKRVLDSKELRGLKDFFGFGDQEFNLRDFVMRGVKAINDSDLHFEDAAHPISTPCHFSVVAGMKNLAKIASFETFCDERTGEKGISRKHMSRDDFSQAPLRIQRYVSHCRNKSPENPVTWVMKKQFDGFYVELGLAYDQHYEKIDPRFSFFEVEKVNQKTSKRLLDKNQLIEKYQEFVRKLLPLTAPTYLYPQARFLLKMALVNETTIQELSQERFIEQLMNKP